ncbi:unnamed protein product [Paramecium pentaurelia]|uniref:Uncharacterized protein n=1 Tax=Paramecium pentaurelia TaxID=43138 RepID=A0A8S1WNM9_9CILI|nr:unnamed protein product [Paramecium pentaurelia]
MVDEKYLIKNSKSQNINIPRNQHKFEILGFILLFGKGVVCSIKNAYIWNIYKLMNGDQKCGNNLKSFYSLKH